MMAAKPGRLDAFAFAIAEADKKWHWADAEIAGNKGSRRLRWLKSSPT